MKIIILLIVIGLAAGLAWQWYTHRPQYMPPLPTTLKRGLQYLYYGPVDGAEDHVTAAFEFNWGGAADTAEKMKRHGLPTWLTLSAECYSADDFRPLPDAGQRVLATLQVLQASGVLHQVVALYPLDEPDMHGVSDAEVTAMCATVRAAAAQFNELADVKLAVIYTDKPGLPGFAAHDWVAIDPYNGGSNMFLQAPYKNMVARLGPHQEFFVVPPGGDPWRQDPEAYRRIAHSTPQCLGIVPFMYGKRFDSKPPAEGIGANGMAAVYRAVGLEIKGNP